MTKEDLELTGKYMNSYSDWCSNHQCDDTCPVWVRRQEYKKNMVIKSCFRTFCEIMEEKAKKDS